MEFAKRGCRQRIRLHAGASHPVTFERFDPSDNAERLEALSSDGPVLVFKHSPSCGVSVRAMQAVRDFRILRPETPVFLVDVLVERSRSRDLAHDLQIGHASPQVILVRRGRAVWSASHWRVAAAAIAEAVATTEEATADRGVSDRDARVDRR